MSSIEQKLLLALSEGAPAPPGPNPHGERSPAADRHALRVAVADGNDLDRAQLAAQLNAVDPMSEVIQAADGAAFLEAVTRRDPHLCFVDRKLPNVDGKALLEAVGARRNRTLFILVSDKLIPTWPEVAQHIQVYDMLLKPVQRERAESVMGSFRRMRTPARTLLAFGSVAALGITRKMLESTWFRLEVDEADRGRAAVRRAASGVYDLAIVDTALPDMTGLEAAAQIRAACKGLKLILTSPNADSAPRLLQKELGISAHLQQPFGPLELESALHDAFSLWRPYLSNALERTRAPRHRRPGTGGSTQAA
jgi:CheY-like chemotaxis protein